MKCVDFREIIDSYLSDELLTETNHDILRHLENCANCRAEIEARRLVRKRLKSAVISSPQYQVNKEFTTRLNSKLRQTQSSSSQQSQGFLQSRNYWMVAAASLLLVFTFGYFALLQFGGEKNSEIAKTPKVADLPNNHIVNVALGDHEYCAVKKDFNRVSLAKSVKKYQIQNVVKSPLKKVVADSKLIESHFCKYKNISFAHLVFEKAGKLMSVLVTDEKNFANLKKETILNVSSEKYHVSHFRFGSDAVFVISDLDKETNFKAAKAIFEPLQKHFSETETFKTALLAFY